MQRKLPVLMLDRIKSIFKVTSILVLFIIGVIIFLNVLAYLVRNVVYKGKLDPVEFAVTQALNSKDAFLGSSVNKWTDALGDPDMIVINHDLYPKTEFYWLDKGLGIGLGGKFKDLEDARNKQVDYLIVPLTKDKLDKFRKGRTLLYKKDDITEIRFNKIMDGKIDGTTFTNLTKKEIYQAYGKFDASNNYYYHIPFPFRRTSTRLHFENKQKCNAIQSCDDDISVITVKYVNLFDFNGFIKGLKFTGELIAALFYIPEW